MRTPAHESCGPSKEPANSSRFLVRPRLYMALSLVLSLLYISTTFLDSTSGQLPTLVNELKKVEKIILMNAFYKSCQKTTFQKFFPCVWLYVSDFNIKFFWCNLSHCHCALFLPL